MQLANKGAAGGLRFRRCQTIPHPPNPAFCGRKHVLEAISAAFEEQTSQPASVAIWGTGGIGKTHIALEFAHRLWSSGEETILWIASEKPAEVAKSFNDAAKELELEGYAPTNNPDQNRRLVLQWLQQTDAPWLLVFDNVESHETVIQNWPTVGQGKILVTCRSIPVAEADIVAKKIEVPAFTVPETTEMIRRILDEGSTPGNGGQFEEDATNRLSAKLGGLPLVIDIVAKQIRLSRRFGSVAEYLSFHEANQVLDLKPSKPEGADPWCYQALHDIWQPAFDDLSEDAAELLGVLCFMSPEAIPTFLFQGEDWVKNAANILLDSAFISTNDESGVMAVHRLIQDSYFLHMTPEARLESFYSALVLLRTHFPSQQVNGSRHFFREWDLCGRLHQHIVAFRDRCQSPQNRAALPITEPTFTDLIRDDTWYMVEIQQFLQAESSLLSILGGIEAGSLLAASIQRSLLGLYERTGRSVKACSAAETEFKILETHGVYKGNDLANAHSNVGYAMASAFRGAEGLKYLDVAVAMAKAHPEPECYQDYNIDRFLRNRGRCRMQMNQFDEALRDFDEAEYYQNKFHGPNSHYHGETKHERSKIAAWQGDLVSALQLSRDAQALVSAGKPTHASVMATLYRQGRILMLQGDDNAALQQLEQALIICQLNEPHRGNAGESARVQWRMSQVYERKGMVGKAMQLRDMAEGVKRELLGTGDYAVPDDEEAGWDALVGLLYR
ncbi:P-loop containing nucleoside triphosphate hydrolase protein [Cercophora newfieldiana]|uniref:P-loop containing nucleoside triphosphate hydrolase protein n=1 Tax=Cercophora newfieldiana TaxID=92897 RepID=A0AA39XZ38_9PEZI|nr:P-loop containing nucleoside triphosphate hydrolase protein [Cercophora newfieldiana]